MLHLSPDAPRVAVRKHTKSAFLSFLYDFKNICRTKDMNQTNWR